MLNIQGLNAYYDSLQALNNISLDVEEGQIVSIIGANGAGKSTLLKSISGLVRSKNGKIAFRGKAISGLPANSIVKTGISHVLEGRQLFVSLTVLDNLNLGAYIHNKRKRQKFVEEKREEVFELFPILKERSKQLAGTLSGGEQQMLVIGRAMMAQPDLLMLDEPSLGLAPIIVQNIFDIIKNLNDHGTTILLVEQNAKMALGVSDFAYVLETGTVLLKGKGQELLANDSVQQAYLGSM